jgi:long-chain acyl-CoA synthetase
MPSELQGVGGNQGDGVMDLLIDFLQPGKVIFRKKVFDPETVKTGIESVARYLNDNLVSDSPFVYLFASNHIKTVFSYFGIIKARRICVIMDPKIGPLELQEMLQDTPPAACIRIDTVTEAFDFSKEIELRKQPWKDDPNEDLSDVCTMIYTAAEDGFAKAVMLTHENILANARAVVEVGAFSDKTVSYSLMEFNHLFSLQVGVIGPFLVSGNIVIDDISDLTNCSLFANAIQSFNVTDVFSVPIIYYLLSKVIDISEKVKSVPNFVSGGYKLSDDIFHRFLKKTGKEIHEGYGLSEASPICTWHRADDQIKIRSVGRAFPCCEIKIDKNGTGDDKIGEICIKGSNVMKGYYRDINAINRTSSGWLKTGDLGYLDEGYLYFAGLKKRMINYGGKKVYPSEVERLMNLHSNVLAIEIFGTEDNLLGHKVEAKIRLKTNSPQKQNEFKEWCRKNISNYKIFSRVEFA